MHLHRLNLVAESFDAAARNFSAAAPDRRELLGALLLTEASRERVFERLAQRTSIGEWALQPAAGESETLIASSARGSLAVICGRQVRADNGIEVSALGTRAEFEDRQSLGAAVAAVRRSGALLMIPWGFGKWMGYKGKMVAEFLHANADNEFYMGDSGCRLGWLRAPKLVRAARAANIGVMAGTDPFPFGADHRRTGSFGFRAVEPSMDAPWRGLRAWLAQRPGQLETYGAPTGMARFLFNQLGIHVHGRLSRNRTAL